ncbi:MAG: urease accessory protein UreF [Alphaproteobacteria bacterium]
MLTDEGLYRLMSWLSPAFPVGAFSYSHGLEYAVEAGLVTDAGALTEWIAAILTFGAGRADATLFRAAWRAADAGDDAALDWAAERADILRPSSEMALESGGQGAAFLGTLRQVWDDRRFADWAARLDAMDRQPAYCVAVAVAAAWLEVPLRPALTAFLQAVSANLISAGLRLVPLGQTDGQRAVAALEPTVLAAADAALARPLADLGGAAPMVDWTAMMHETQYTRLFRS